MTSLRSTRLEAIFGKKVSDLTAADIHQLASNQVAEDFDLEFKSQLYGKDRDGVQACAGDISAIANSAGGVIILGVEEDDQARAVRTPGVPLSDGEATRISVILADHTAQVPPTAIRLIEDPPGSGHGFLTIAVPRSPAGPHAALVNKALRYPVRNGRSIRYLSEPEVADAYRRRFETFSKQAEVAAEAEGDLQQRLRLGGVCWLIVSLVPDLPGHFVVDHQSWLQFQQESLRKKPGPFFLDWSWGDVGVGRRRLVAASRYDESQRARRMYTELHDSGAGAFAQEIQKQQLEDGRLTVVDEALAASLITGVHYLARHARDRAAAAGTAMLRATLLTSDPVTLVQANPWADRLGTRNVEDFGRSAERFAPLDELAAEGTNLVVAAHMLGTDLVQAFGLTEIHQYGRDGQIRLPYWNYIRPSVEAWGHRNSVPLSDETLPSM